MISKWYFNIRIIEMTTNQLSMHISLLWYQAFHSNGIIG